MLERTINFSRRSILHAASGWFYGFYAWCIFVFCLTAFGSLAILVHRSDWAHRLIQAGARALLWLGRIELAASGLERLPATPHILLANHASFVDPIALAALLPAKTEYAFTARQEFRSQLWLYPLLKSIGTIILKRHDQRHVVPNLELLTDALRKGKSLVVFPEGGFRPEPGLRHFHSGAFAAAKTAGVPIVIATLNGARSVLRSGSWMPHRSPMHLEIGIVMDAGEVKDASIEQLMRRAYVSMSSLVDE